MSWPVRSKRLAVESNALGAYTKRVIGTVPAGKVWLVKQIICFGQGAGTRDVYFYIRSGAVDYTIARFVALLNNEARDANNYHVVLAAGEQIVYQQTATTLTEITVHGAQLG